MYIMPLIILIIGIIIIAIVEMTGNALIMRYQNQLAYDTQDAISKIEYDVSNSHAFLAQNNITLQTPQGVDDGSTSFQNTSNQYGNALILDTYATTLSSQNPNRSLAYLNYPNNCSSPNVVNNKPLPINVVYYVKDNALWRRTIMPQNYTSTTCSTPWQKPSCYPGIDKGTFCAADDSKLIDGLSASGFTIDYYSSPTDTVGNSGATNPNNSVEARSQLLSSFNTIKLSINISKNAAGQLVKYQSTDRLTLGN